MVGIGRTRLLISALAISSVSLVAYADDGAEKKEKEPVDVYVEKLEPTDVFDAMVYGGFVEPLTRQSVAPEVDGTLNAILVHPGSKVRRGATLFNVRPTSLGQGYRLHSAISPIAGTVTRVERQVGDRLARGETAVEVADLSELRTKIHVTYEDLFHVSDKVPVEIVVADGTTHEARTVGKVLSIAPAPDLATGTYPVELSLACSTVKGQSCSDAFRLGALLKVIIKKNFRRNIMIPISSLNNDRTKVFLVGGDGRFKKVAVTTGSYYADRVEIVKGLSAGDRLVTKHAEEPEEGEVAKVLTPKDRGAISAKDEGAEKTKG